MARVAVPQYRLQKEFFAVHDEEGWDHFYKLTFHRAYYRDNGFKPIGWYVSDGTNEILVLDSVLQRTFPGN